MGGNFLLDTNVVIAFINRDASVIGKVSEASAIAVPSVVLGKLYYGAEKSAKVRYNLDRIEEFSVSRIIISCDQGTARQYGAIKQALHVRGRPIPENDIWIAATALQHGLALVTRDAHFFEIDGLTPVEW